MRKQYHIEFSLSLLMRRVGVVLFMAFVMLSCQTIQVPIDDAYYSPVLERPAAVFPPPDSEAQPVAADTVAAPKTTPKPTLEYTSIRDTTITVKIKR